MGSMIATEWGGCVYSESCDKTLPYSCPRVSSANQSRGNRALGYTRAGCYSSCRRSTGWVELWKKSFLSPYDFPWACLPCPYVKSTNSWNSDKMWYLLIYDHFKSFRTSCIIESFNSNTIKLNPWWQSGNSVFILYPFRNHFIIIVVILVIKSRFKTKFRTYLLGDASCGSRLVLAEILGVSDNQINSRKTVVAIGVEVC